MYRPSGFDVSDQNEIVDSFKIFNGTINMELVKKLVRGYANASHASRPVFERNLTMLRSKAALRAARTDRPFLPLPDRNGSDITIGKLLQGDREFGDFRLDVSDLVHTLLVGSTGTGKSTLIWRILKQLVEKNCKTLIFDRKRDMRNIINSVPIAIISANDLRINIFDPPSSSINPHSWISKVCDLFTIFGLYYSSRNYIKEFVINIMEETKQIPTIFDVYYSIKSKSERGQTRGNYHDASLNKIQNIVGELGSCFSCRKSFPLKELLEVPLAIEVDQLSMQSERFLIAYFLLALIEIRKAESIRGNPSIDSKSLFVFIDEAANLWNPQMDFSERTQEMSFDILQEIPLIARDYKICLFFASQRPLSKNIMANVRTKLLSNIPDSEDAWYMANSVGVKPKIFQKMDPGEFMVKTGKTDSFLIRTERIEREIIDDEKMENIKKPFVEHIIRNCTPLTEIVSVENRDESAKLNSDSKKFLLNVASFPSLTVTQRYDMLKLKGRYAQELKQSLIERQMAEEVFLAIGSTKLSTFLVPTQKAIDYLASIGEPSTYYKHIGKTSALHQLIQAIVIEFFVEKGFSVSHDCQLGEKFVDVLVEKTGIGGTGKVIFEVAVNPSIDTDRVATTLGLVDQFVILAADIMVLRNMENTLGFLKSDKITILLASPFLASLKKGVPAIIQLNTLEQQNNKNSQNPASSDVEQTENGSN